MTKPPAVPPLMEHALLVASPRYGELILVRHAQQGDNGLNDPLRPKAGDARLSELGERQADAVADELAGLSLEAVYSSHLARAATTARKIAARHGMEPIIHESLREVGVYRDLPAGRTVADEIGETGVAEVRRHFLADRRWDAFPLSEPREEMQARIHGTIDAILASHPESSRVVVVAHGGVINAVVRRVLGVDADMFFYPAHASVTRLGRGDGRIGVVSLNEQQHLRRSNDVHVTY